MTDLEFCIDNLGHFTCLEVHFTKTRQNRLDFHGLVGFGDERILHHAFLFFFCTFAFYANVGIIIVAIYGISAGLAHFGREGADECFIILGFLNFAFLYIGKEFIQIHYVHVPITFFTAAHEHFIGLVGQECISQVRTFCSLNNLACFHFDEIDLGRSIASFLSVGGSGFNKLIIPSA